MNRRIAVRAIILQGDKLLCVRLKPTEAAPHNGSFWCVPGGGLESEESLIAGLDRELIEETGIKPQVGNLLYVQQYEDDKAEYLEFFFAVTNAKDYLHIDLAATTHGIQELQEISFIDPGSVKLLPSFLIERPIAEDVRLGVTHCFSYLQ
jgi:8-oxo-dGTP diphosphatase